jgi:hypothetical protein
MHAFGVNPFFQHRDHSAFTPEIKVLYRFTLQRFFEILENNPNYHILSN